MCVCLCDRCVIQKLIQQTTRMYQADNRLEHPRDLSIATQSFSIIYIAVNYSIVVVVLYGRRPQATAFLSSGARGLATD